MNTSLRLRRLKDKLRLAALLRDRIVRLHGDSPKDIPVEGRADAEHRIVPNVSGSRQPSQNQQSNLKKALKLAQVHLFVVGHRCGVDQLISNSPVSSFTVYTGGG